MHFLAEADYHMTDNTPEKRPASRTTRYVLAIDLGSGGHKVAVVADNGEIVAAADEPVTTYLLPGGGPSRIRMNGGTALKKQLKK